MDQRHIYHRLGSGVLSQSSQRWEWYAPASQLGFGERWSITSSSSYVALETYYIHWIGKVYRSVSSVRQIFEEWTLTFFSATVSAMDPKPGACTSAWGTSRHICWDLDTLYSFSCESNETRIFTGKTVFFVQMHLWFTLKTTKSSGWTSCTFDFRAMARAHPLTSFSSTVWNWEVGDPGQG